MVSLKKGDLSPLVYAYLLWNFSLYECAQESYKNDNTLSIFFMNRQMDQEEGGQKMKIRLMIRMNMGYKMNEKWSSNKGQITLKTKCYKA